MGATQSIMCVLNAHLSTQFQEFVELEIEKRINENWKERTGNANGAKENENSERNKKAVAHLSSGQAYIRPLATWSSSCTHTQCDCLRTMISRFIRLLFD